MVQKSLSWLRQNAASVDSVSSLAWCILSLFVYQEPIGGLKNRLATAEQDAEGWDRCIAVNLRGVFLSSKYAIPYMLDKGGSIVHTSSGTGIVGVRNRAAYSATKGPIVALTRTMALDYARDLIRLNCVC